MNFGEWGCGFKDILSFCRSYWLGGMITNVEAGGVERFLLFIVGRIYKILGVVMLYFVRRYF